MILFQLVMLHRDGRESTPIPPQRTYVQAECEGRSLIFWLPEEYCGFRIVEVENEVLTQGR